MANNQGHYCGEKVKSIDEYILAQNENKQNDLFYLRRILIDTLPHAVERISWSMPTLWKTYNILHFAVSKAHIGFYPGLQAVEHYVDELSSIKRTKEPYAFLTAELMPY